MSHRSIRTVFTALALLGASLLAADGPEMLPEALGEFEREEIAPLSPENAGLFAEFGFDRGQRARYATLDGSAVEILAWRFDDPTGAFAAYQWMQPQGAEEVPYGQRALQSGEQTLIHFGNYVVEMRGQQPLDENVELMLTYLPRVQVSADPPVVDFVPRQDLVPNSQRHILGPAALEKLAPEIPPSVAAFHFGTEAQYLRYETPAGEHRMLLFSYPSSQISRGQLDPFRELENVVAKREGPLIAAVVSPSSPDEAQRLLARVRYAAEVTPHHREPERHESLVTLLIDIFLLCLVLVGLMIVGGVLVAGARIFLSRTAPNSILAPSEDADIIRLDIEEYLNKKRS